MDNYSDSPFIGSQTISLDIGSKPIRYCVHRAFLSQSEVLHSKISPTLWQDKTDIIALPDLDTSTAHTLVTFLYSGKYETLEPHRTSKKGKRGAYEACVSVYCAAMRYKVRGLAELARKRITSLEEQVPILDVLSIARETAFPNLPEDDSWFAIYLSDAIKIASERDPELLVDSMFSDQLEGDRRFRHVVVKAIIACHSIQEAKAQEQDREDNSSTAQVVDEGSAQDAEAHKDPVTDPEPSEWPEAEPEPSYEAELEPPYEPQPEPADEPPSESESELTYEPAPAPEPEIPIEPEPAKEPEAEMFNGNWGTPTSSKKKKKKKAFSWDE